MSWQDSTLPYGDLLKAIQAAPVTLGAIPSRLPIVVTPDPLPVLVQYKFPRSKKRRIRRKWTARPDNFHWTASNNPIPDGEVWRTAEALHANPRTAHTLRQHREG
jgi:hypothetical protein